MIDTTEIEAEEVLFVCASFFVISSRNNDYLCYGKVRYAIENITASYEEKCVYFYNGSPVFVNEIGIFDFYLTAYYRTRFWVDLA